MSQKLEIGRLTFLSVRKFSLALPDTQIIITRRLIKFMHQSIRGFSRSV